MDENWTHHVPCRYYANGTCREGESCRYLHQAQSGTSLCNTSFPRCRFYRWGSCIYGSQCRFLHVSDVPVSGHGLNSDTMINATSSATHDYDGIRQQNNHVSSSLGPGIPNEGLMSSLASSASVSNVSTPKQKHPWTYTNAVKFSDCTLNSGQQSSSTSVVKKLCPYQEAGECKYGSVCDFIHGEICDLCGVACLHPQDEEQQKKHRSECVKQHEQDMEYSFAVARSRDKVCGVCFEVILDKPPSERRFGILPNCSHCFCLSCIRKWRQVKQFENKIIRACPECRVTSDFVCPSVFWVDTPEEKEKLINSYKSAMSTKDCKYFKSGEGKCPFGNKCFYLHAYPDGTKANLGPPRRRLNAEGELDFFEDLFLWDFLEDRGNSFYNLDELLSDIISFSDSEDSDSSEYD